MKKFLFSALFISATLSSFAGNHHKKVPATKAKVVSECCTVTVSNPETGDQGRSTQCRTKLSDACDAAYKSAKKIVCMP